MRSGTRFLLPAWREEEKDEDNEGDEDDEEINAKSQTGKDAEKAAVL